MKNTKKITLCGIVAAISVVIMLTSYFPYLTYAIPAVAGLFMMVSLIECGTSWAFLSYVTSAAIVFIVGENEAKLLYIMFLGYYPILKSVIEKLKNGFVEWLLKLLCFNVAAISFYFIASLLFSIQFDDFSVLGKYGALIFLLMCNAVFVLYDIGISRVAVFYLTNLHKKVEKIMKQGL